MKIDMTVTDTTRATITALPDGGPYYITVQMSRGEVTNASLWHWTPESLQAWAPNRIADITLLFTNEEAVSLLERVRLAIESERARIERIGVRAE